MVTLFVRRWFYNQNRYLLPILAIIITAFIFTANFFFVLENRPTFIAPSAPPKSLSVYLSTQSVPVLSSTPSSSPSSSTQKHRINYVEFVNSSTTEFNEENWIKLRLNQYDPRLVKIVQKKVLIPPPPVSELDYTYNESWVGDERGNTKKFEWLQQQLGPGPGFFIECGAHDGIFLSNTLRLEKTRNWTGLLIEPYPDSFQKMLKNKRNAWKVNAALCTTPVAKEVPFWIHSEKNSNKGVFSSLSMRTIKEWPDHEEFINITVPCVPFYTILAAMNVSTVDFLNLDVEGAELEILETVPFHKITFKTLAIEYNHVRGGQEALRRFLQTKGYRYVDEIVTDTTFDSLFVHRPLKRRS